MSEDSFNNLVRLPGEQILVDATKSLKMLHYHLGSKSEWSNEIGDVHLDESDNLGLTPKKTSQQVLSAFGAIIDCLEESRIG